MNAIQLTRTKLDLQKSAVFALAGAEGVRVRCESGLLWVTLESDPADHWLQHGQCLTIRSQGRVVVEAIRGSEMLLLPPRQQRLTRPAERADSIPAHAAANAWHEEAGLC
jgi:hypothetical protein